MSELLRLRDRVKKAEIWYLEKVSKTAARGFKNDAVNLRRSWGNSRLIFWSVSELGGAIDVSKRKVLSCSSFAANLEALFTLTPLASEIC